jgi:hypothetical protein
MARWRETIAPRGRNHHHHTDGRLIMRRVTLLIALLALLAGGFGPASAAAQDSTGATGITTVGYGHASAPAATANLQFLIMYNYFYGGPAVGAGGPEAGIPVAEATPGAQIVALLDPIVQHVRGIEGVESAEVVLPLIPTYQRDPNILGRLDVTLASPTRESLTNLYLETTEVTLDNRLMVGFVGAAFTATDCEALEREARQAAVDDARARAELQAETMGVTLGDPIASEDVFVSSDPIATAYGAVPPATGGCDPATRSASSTGQLYPGVTLPPFDPGTQGGEIEVYRQVYVTFAIAG